MYPRVCVCFFFGAIPIRTRVFGANIFEFVCESEFPRAPLFERVLFSVIARARGQTERERERVHQQHGWRFFFIERANVVELYCDELEPPGRECILSSFRSSFFFAEPAVLYIAARAAVKVRNYVTVGGCIQQVNRSDYERERELRIVFIKQGEEVELSRDQFTGD